VHTIFTPFTPDAQQTQQLQQQQQQGVQQVYRAVLEDPVTVERQQDAADNRRLQAMFDKALAALQRELAPVTVRLYTNACVYTELLASSACCTSSTAEPHHSLGKSVICSTAGGMRMR
jgi:hypothetical protein